jgi:hypothetical protein
MMGPIKCAATAGKILTTTRLTSAYSQIAQEITAPSRASTHNVRVAISKVTLFFSRDAFYALTRKITTNPLRI